MNPFIPMLLLYVTCTITPAPPSPSVYDLNNNDEMYLVHIYKFCYNTSMFLNIQKRALKLDYLEVSTFQKVLIFGF